MNTLILSVVSLFAVVLLITFSIIFAIAWTLEGKPRFPL